MHKSFCRKDNNRLIKKNTEIIITQKVLSPKKVTSNQDVNLNLGLNSMLLNSL